MHLSYYFLQFVSSALHEKLKGFVLAECYLQNREEVVFAFCNPTEEFFIKLNLHQEHVWLSFPSEFSKNKKGTYAIFNELKNLKVIGCIQHLNDRSFHIEFENDFSILFKLHGSRSNILLFYQNDCIDILNKNLPHDKEVNLSQVHKNTSQTYAEFVAIEGNFKKLFPAFDKEIVRYLDVNGYQTKSIEEKWMLIQEVLKTLNTKHFYLIKSEEERIELNLFSKGVIIAETTDAIEACNLYERYFGQIFYFEKERKSITAYLLQKIKKSKSYLEIVEVKLNEIKNRIPYNQIADIIMANLYQIDAYAEQVELLNFYTGKTIAVKLKKGITPQKNAEIYYRKSKNQKLEISELEKNIASKKQEVSEYNNLLGLLEQCSDLKSLRKFAKEHHLNEEKAVKTKEQESLFKRFEAEGFEILVGKNARNNDLLTQKYSFKEDLWLHARDVAGSHVLVKYKAGKKFPKTVIEKAAQIAAYYSKRKSDSLCPVIVTTKKFVRKPKGALDGQVIVDREEVVMVKPMLQ